MPQVAKKDEGRGRVTLTPVRFRDDRLVPCGPAETISPREFIQRLAVPEMTQLDRAKLWSARTGSYVGTYRLQGDGPLRVCFMYNGDARDRQPKLVRNHPEFVGWLTSLWRVDAVDWGHRFAEVPTGKQDRPAWMAGAR